jgi:hypothetical protein
MHKLLPFAAAFILASGVAQAQVGASADIGTTGFGAHLVVPLSPSLNGRIGANYFQYDFTRSSGQLDYDLDGKLQTVDALLDWYPSAGSSFRLTGGVFYNKTRFDATAEPNGLNTFRLNGNVYNVSEVGIVVGKVDFRKAAPYLGIGWGNAMRAERGWGFGADLGVFYQGSARVSLRSENCTVLSTVCQRLAQDIAAEQVRLADDVSDYKFYPVVRASLSYRF